MAKTIAALLCGGALFLAAEAYGQETAVPANIPNSVVCLRNTTIRKKPVYDNNGNLTFVKEAEQSYGTGFVYMEKEGYYYIATNHHVACGDKMSDGTKKVKDLVEIVDSIEDSDPKDDILLEPVAVAKSKDIAILKVSKPVVTAYHKQFGILIEAYHGRWGNSDTLQKGQKIVIEGFPFGKFKATTEGVVSNPKYMHKNRATGANHSCVVYDAATNPGNSGSPAFRKNSDGSFELMGQVHAGFTAEGMKLFVAINEYQSMLLSLASELEQVGTTPAKGDIETILKHLSSNNIDNLFSLNEQISFLFFVGVKKTFCSANKHPDGIEFVVYRNNFPNNSKPAIKLIDKAENSYGTVDSIGLSSDIYGDFALERENIPSDMRTQFDGLFEHMTELYAIVSEYKTLVKKADKTFDESERAAKLSDQIGQLQRNKSVFITEFNKSLAVFLLEYYASQQKERATAKEK